MGLHDVGEIPTLLSFNVGAAAGLSFVSPVLAQFNLALTGAFGIGSLQADLSAQFQAALSASADISLSVSDPTVMVRAMLAVAGQLVAALSASLSLGLPALSLEISAQLAAAASLMGTLRLKLGGITALLQAALAVKLPAVKFFAELAANLSAGPAVILSWDQSDGVYRMSNLGADLNGLFSITGLHGLQPTDPVYGVLIITKAPSCYAGIKATLLVA